MPFIPFVAIGVFIAANASWLVPLLSTVISIGLGFVAKALAPKPKQPTFEQPPTPDRTQMVKAPITKRRYPLGEMKLGGIVTYTESTDNNRVHRVVCALCDGPIGAIPVVWFNDQPIYADQIDGDGEVTAGPFKGKAVIKKFLGATDQAQNPNLPAGFRGRGVAYIDVLIRWDADTYPLGLPDLSAEIRGLTFLDPRDSVEKFALNPALLVRGILANTFWGGGYETDTLPDLWFNAAANVCDEFVTVLEATHTVAEVVPGDDKLRLTGGKLKFQTGDRVEVTSTGSLPGGISAATPYYVIVVRARNRGPAPEWEVGIDGDQPEKLEIKLASSYALAVAGTPIDITDAGSGAIAVTKTGEPRYTVNGIFESSQGWLQMVEQAVAAMSGRAVYAGGEWRVRAGAYAAPDVEIVPKDIIAPVKIQTRVPRRDRFNTISGAYYNPLNDWQPQDYPHITDAAYQVEDGERIPRDFDLPLTTRANTAQRLAQIELRRVRGNEITVDVTCSLKAMQMQAGDTCLLTIPEFGFEEKPFEIQTWALTVEQSGDVPMLAVAMTLRETQPNVYSFNPADDEEPVEPVARTTLANAWSVPAPTSLYARTTTTETDMGDTVFGAVLSWSIATQAVVAERGRFEIQTRRSSGLALIFDGVNDYVVLDTIVDLTASPQAFTVEGWCYWDGSAPTEYRSWFTNGQLWVYREATSGYVTAAISIGGSPLYANSTVAMVQDEWMHWAATWDGGTLTLLLDGVIAATASGGGGSFIRETEDGDIRITEDGDTRLTEDAAMDSPIALQIGRGIGSVPAANYWPGGIDEVRIWRGLVRTEAEIAETMDLALSGREDFLLHYYPMDTPIVATLVDGTIAGNNGTITGAVYAEGALASQWTPSWFIDGSERATALPTLQANQSYDIRIRTVNALGVRSAWSTLFGFVVGESGGATEQLDWGSIADGTSGDEDWDSVANAVDETDDWGALV